MEAREAMRGSALRIAEKKWSEVINELINLSLKDSVSPGQSLGVPQQPVLSPQTEQFSLEMLKQKIHTFWNISSPRLLVHFS